MKPTVKSFIILSMITFTACSTMQSDDPASLAFDIPTGSTLTLNQDLQIGQKNTHAMIQAGKVLQGNPNEYEINCSFDFRNFGPRTIKPETFAIRRVEDGHEWFSYPIIMRFYTVIYLGSSQDTDVIKLECQRWGKGIDNHFTVAEMMDALGDIFTFSFSATQ